MNRRIVGLTVLVAVMAFLGSCGGEPRVKDPGTPKQPTPPDGVATLDGRSIHYEAYGWDNTEHPARAVALVHGWASDTSTWSRQIEPLARHARVLAIDLPGHGMSDPPEGEFSMDLFARAIEAVLDDAGIEYAALVGHSNGTPAIRQFYRLYPDRTGALVIVDGALRNMLNEEIVAGFQERLESDTYDEFIEMMIDGMLASSPDAEAIQDEIMVMALGTPQETLVGSFLAGADPAIWIEDPIAAPTLIVLADAPFWDEEYEAHVRLTVPKLEYHKLQGVSHYLHMDAPETFNDLLLDFLRRVGFASD